MEKKPNFIGTTFHVLDTKNRLAIPARMRAYLSRQTLILTRGLEGCLNLYPLPAWLSLSEKLESLAMKNKAEKRSLLRILYGNACEVELDNEGRILIPQSLVDYAKLSKEIAIVGLVKFLEIWAKARWAAQESKQQGILKKHSEQFEL